MNTQTETCSYRGCECTLEACSVTFGEKSYCCGDCADGVGCDHQGCTCGCQEHPPPGFTSFIQNAVRHLHK